MAALLSSACATPNPTPTSTTVPRTSAPGESATPNPSANAPIGDWAKVELPPLVASASLEPTKQGDAGAAIDTAFRLRSLDGSPVAGLAARLTVEPAVELRADAPAGDTVVLRPAKVLTPGTTYRFQLRREDGTLAGAWGVTAAKPLHVVGSLPDDRATDVPRNTGIEIRFDQSGITGDGLRPYFAIAPPVAGRFEVHGRVVAYVPSADLKARTVYTVTVRHGLPLPGTGQVLERDVIARFETTGVDETTTRLLLPGKLTDAGTLDAPAIGISFFDTGEDEAKLPKTLPIRVHRVASLASAISAYGRLATAPDWARSGGAPIDTSVLPEVLRATLRVHAFSAGSESGWVQLPQRLSLGWYVATFTFAGDRVQTLIQVTDVATYVLVSETRTVVWTNDIRTGRAIPGARLTLGAKGIGRTGSDGLRIATTPAAAKTLAGSTTTPLILKVNAGAGRTMFVPVDRRGICGKCDDYLPFGFDALDTWWHVLGQDRTLFRSTDAANVWGIVRSRDGGALPKTLDVAMVTTGVTGEAGAPIVSAHPTPDANGAYVAELAFRDLPPGEYRIQVRAEGTLIDESYFSIAPIVKPGYTLSVAPSERAILSGDTVKATVRATFFEGTPVAGVGLYIGFGREEGDEPILPSATTAVDGIASATASTVLDVDDQSQWEWRDLMASPLLPEEASIEGHTQVAVFRSTALMSESATLAGRDLTVTGTVNDVAFGRFDVEGGPGADEIDPIGAPRAGARVSIVVTEVVQTRRQIGTEYDFITKQTVPTYDYGERRTDVATRTLKTGKDGSFKSSFTVTGGDRFYDVVARYTDQGGRSIVANATADSNPIVQVGEQPFLSVPGHRFSEIEYSVGDRFRVAFHGGHPDAARDRYLFMVSQQGLGSAAVQPGPVFTTTFRTASVPNKSIDAVRFTGSAYEVVLYGYEARFKTEDRRLTVTITPDATRYQPGGHVEVTVKTTDRAGHPVAASVVVRAIDEKLYAIQAASDVDPLYGLYRSVPDGTLATNWSHRSPRADDGGGGDTGGGGGDDRTDFRDWLVFRLVRTGADGLATVGFDLSDDLTSWRVSAGAVDAKLQAGTGSLGIPVGLPFFAEVTLGAEYLLVDRPILRLRGFGTALSSVDRVSFEVSAPSLGMSPTKVEAAAFATAQVPLPALALGDHQVRIVATTGSGAAQRRDVLVRTIHVVASRSVQTLTTNELLVGDVGVHGGSTGLTTVVLSDAGRGRVLPFLLSIITETTKRADEAIAAALARRVLQASFASSVADLGTSDADLASFQSPEGGGIALLPYASADLELSVLAALADDPRLDPVTLARSFRDVLDDPEAARDRRILALAGQAALGEPVLDLIRSAAAEPTLEPTERAWLALAAMAAGDSTLAGDLERALLRDSGERLGPWVRLSLGDRETGITTTAIVAIVAAGIGDPLAADLDAYLGANPPKDTLLVLQRALAARLWAERTAGAAAAATVTVAGVTRALTIEPDAPVWLTFTPAQLPTVRFATTRGQVLMATRWEGPLDAASIRPSSKMAFDRIGAPVGPIGADQVVSVDFTVDLGDDADNSCHVVTDLVPSGLAPLARPPTWYDDSEDLPSTEGPWRITGQRVEFIVCHDPRVPVHSLHYVARVVSPGTYRWESAVLQSSVVPERGIVLPSFDIEIRPLD